MSSHLARTLAGISFSSSSDAEVSACAHRIFATLQREARDLAASSAPLAAADAKSFVLGASELPEALTSLLATKLARAPDEVGGLRGAILDELRTRSGLRSLVFDLVKVIRADPAVESLAQPFLFFKGFHAISAWRVAHALWTRGGRGAWSTALALQSRCSELFGVDIHPAATIGDGVCLDHATGIVIGSTAKVGSDVYLLHGVTLGASGGKERGASRGARRHPSVGTGVTLGAGCTLLGGIRIGDGATVGAGAVITRDVPPRAIVVGANRVLAAKL